MGLSVRTSVVQIQLWIVKLANNEKMMKKFYLLLLLVAVSCTGCVNLGTYDVSDIARLQQALVGRGVVERSDEGLDPYLPGSGILPPVKVTKDPKTKRNRIELTLQQVILLTLANDMEIHVVSYEPQIAREQMVQAAAEFDYTIFGSLGYDRADTAVRNFTGLQDPGRILDFEVGLRQKTITGATWELTNTMVCSWDDAATVAANKWMGNNLGLQLTQPLLRGGWAEVNLANLKIARINHKISMAQFRSKVEARIVEAITTYYSLIQARKLVEIADALLDVTMKTYQKMEDRRPLDATDVQVMQALSAVKTREAILLSAQKDAKDAQDALVNILSDQQLNYLEDFDLIPVDPLSTTLVEIDEADQLLTALRLNPSLEQARLAIQNAEVNIVVARNDLLPTLNFIAGVSFDGGSEQTAGRAWNDFVSGDFVSYNAALTFEYPIGNREARSAYAQSKYERFQLVAQMQDTTDNLAETIRDKIRQVSTEHKKYLAQVQAAEASKKQLIALDNLEEIRGKLTPEFLNLKLFAQGDIATAESSALNALVKYNVALLDIELATGSVLEMNQVKLALPVVSRTKPLDGAGDAGGDAPGNNNLPK